MAALNAQQLNRKQAPALGHAPRADALFIAALGIVALLVVALLVAFSAQSRMHARTLETISVARSVRDEAQSITQALADVEAARRAAALTRARDHHGSIEAAKAETRAHIVTLQQHAAAHPRLAASAARIGALIEQEFALDAATLSSRQLLLQSVSLRTQLRAAIEELRLGVNAFNDQARGVERRSRERIDVISIALGLLSLLAAGLAVVSLRRERERWRLARDAAEAARARAAAADLAKSRFLAVASHDMRQPLHALTLYLSALERRVDTDEARDIIKKMDRATQSMVGMFSMLLDLARVQAGVMTPIIVDAPLQQVIDRIVAEHPSGKVEAASTPLAVRTDPLLLERILSNLVVNALKHGGGVARIGVHAGDGAAVIEVADNGPGIPLEDQERVFEEFVRLEGRGEGLGLGLAIVKGIARLLGVIVELDSAPGRGTRFTLRLPLAAAPVVKAHPADSAGVLRDIPVLVMDDETLAREAMAATLRDLGAQVRACANADELNAILDEGFRPQLLLLDLRIEGELRGIAIAGAACARIGPSARAIIVTGDTGPDALAALRASDHGWLIKPVDARDLIAAAAAQLQPSA